MAGGEFFNSLIAVKLARLSFGHIKARLSVSLEPYMAGGEPDPVLLYSIKSITPQQNQQRWQPGRETHPSSPSEPSNQTY